MYYKSHLKTLIIIVAIFVVILLIVLLSTRKNVDYVDNYSNLTSVKEHITFFAIEGNINNFLLTLQSNDYEAVYNMLDESYIIKNNITKKNIKDKMFIPDNEVNISIEKMQSTDLDNSIIYVAYGSLIDNSQMDEITIVKENYYIIIKVDYDNFTVSFYPTDENYYDDINTITSSEIKPNYYNTYQKGGLIADDNICLFYLNELSNYKSKSTKIFNNLDDRIKDNYPNETSLIEHLNNYDFNTQIETCEIVNNETYYSIKITDVNKNYFEITETAVLEYKLYFEIS